MLVRTVVAALLFVISPVALAAQFEFGVDGGLEIESFSEGDDNLTTIVLPSDMFRFAFGVSEAVAVEFRAAVGRQSSGGDAATVFRMSPALRYGFKPRTWEGAVPFLRVGGGLTYFSCCDSSETQPFLVGGGGFDIPVSEPVSFRIEGRFKRSFETDDSVASNAFALLLGLTAVVPRG
jgi:hypothetical protein